MLLECSCSLYYFSVGNNRNITPLDNHGTKVLRKTLQVCPLLPPLAKPHHLSSGLPQEPPKLFSLLLFYTLLIHPSYKGQNTFSHSISHTWYSPSFRLSFQWNPNTQKALSDLVCATSLNLPYTNLPPSLAVHQPCRYSLCSAHLPSLFLPLALYIDSFIGMLFPESRPGGSFLSFRFHFKNGLLWNVFYDHTT